MRYALIIAGGSGTRLWPMSRVEQPKQLIPFIKGQSLLDLAMARVSGLVTDEQIYICAGEAHRDVILQQVKGATSERYLGEPEGRDTLNAIAFAAAVIRRQDPDAVIAVLTADHIIEPIETFQRNLTQGFDLVDRQANTLVTFGIKPTYAATAYGYLQLGKTIDASVGGEPSPPRVVVQFQEKPVETTAQRYFDAGPEQYLWNSGMFVWRAATLLDCVRRYEPDTHDSLKRIADAWDGSQRQTVLEEVYPTLKKISIDYAVMEPAAKDSEITVAAVKMPLNWLDVGSWNSFANTCAKDEDGNALSTGRHATIDSRSTLLASSDPNHLITAIGCEDMLIVHTPDATLVCRADRAEDIKKLHELVREKYGASLL